MYGYEYGRAIQFRGRAKRPAGSLVYEIVEAVFDHHEEMMEVHPAAASTVPKNFVNNTFLPYHDGAIRYYGNASRRVFCWATRRRLRTPVLAPSASSRFLKVTARMGAGLRCGARIVDLHAYRTNLQRADICRRPAGAVDSVPGCHSRSAVDRLRLSCMSMAGWNASET